MGKFDFIAFLLGGLFSIVLIIAYVTFVSPLSIIGSGQGISTNINIEEISGNGKTTEYYYNTTTEYIKSDLSQVFLPYLATLNINSKCIVNHSGTWIQTKNKVGCFNMLIPINATTTCSSGAYLTAMQQCTAVGGTAVCNPTNIGCYYKEL